MWYSAERVGLETFRIQNWIILGVPTAIWVGLHHLRRCRWVPLAAPRPRLGGAGRLDQGEGGAGGGGCGGGGCPGRRRKPRRSQALAERRILPDVTAAVAAPHWSRSTRANRSPWKGSCGQRRHGRRDPADALRRHVLRGGRDDRAGARGERPAGAVRARRLGQVTGASTRSGARSWSTRARSSDPAAGAAVPHAVGRSVRPAQSAQVPIRSSRWSTSANPARFASRSSVRSSCAQGRGHRHVLDPAAARADQMVVVLA